MKPFAFPALLLALAGFSLPARASDFAGPVTETMNGQTLTFPNAQQRDRFLAETRGKSTVFSTPKPSYPFLAKQQRFTGRCVVRMTFFRPGLPERVFLVKSTRSTLLDVNTRSWAEGHWRLLRHAGNYPVVKDVPVTYVLD